MPLIDVSEVVKNILDRVKEREGHKSYDGTIRSLLYRTKEIDGKKVKRDETR